MTLLAGIGQVGPAPTLAGLCGPVSALTVASTARISSRIVSSLAALAAFREFLEYILAKHFRRNQAALAKAVGIDVRSLRRTLDPEEGKHTFSLEHCLTLAHTLRQHENASYILRQADKAPQAALIEALYGRPTLSNAEEALLEAWNQMDGPAQVYLLKAAQQWASLADFAHARAPETPAPSTPPKARRARKKR